MTDVLIIAGVAGGLVIITMALAASQYRNEMSGPTYINRNWTVTELPSEWRDSKYRWTESDTSRRTRVRNPYDNILDPRNDYEAILHRPNGGWRGGRTKRKTRRK